jgi:hypothetical protein
MGVSINEGTPKWMVYNGKSVENARLGRTPILGNLLQRLDITYV